MKQEQYIEPIGLQKALYDFRNKYRSITSDDLQTFIIGYEEGRADSALAKALQKIDEQCHLILNEYSNNEGWDEGKLIKGWLNKIGGMAELSEQVLKEAGLTDK